MAVVRQHRVAVGGDVVPLLIRLVAVRAWVRLMTAIGIHEPAYLAAASAKLAGPLAAIVHRNFPVAKAVGAFGVGV